MYRSSLPSLRPRLALAAAAFALAAFALAVCGPVSARAQEPTIEEIEVPAEDVGVAMLPMLRFAQEQTRDRIEVEHDFAFTDRRSESGIAFEHVIVADGGRLYKPVHYDHGNGVAVADVDGDRRYDLYFVNQMGPNELWRNRGDGTFENVTAEAGVGLDDRVSVTASFADYDNDGDADLFVTTVRMGNALFANDGSGRFTDVTESAGVGYSGHSSGAVFFDYDLDGRLDLFVTNVGTYTTDERGPGGYYLGLEDAFSGHLMPERKERSILYRNVDGRRFEDVSVRVGLLDESWSGDATFADLNGDRYPDLYVLNMQGDDHYYENLAGRTFVDKTETVFPATSWGAMGVKFFDYDLDGDLDLIVTDMHSDMALDVTPGLEKLKSLMAVPDAYLQDRSNNIFGNSFYENQGNGRFTEVSDEVGAENYWPWGVSVGDLNADGFEDVVITSSMNYPFRYGINTVLLNNRGERFYDSEFLLGVEPRQGPTKKPWFEVDCSGDDHEHERCRGQVGSKRIMASVGTRAAAIFDYDGDGDLDIVTNEFNDRPLVLTSDLAQKKPVRFLQVRLVGRQSNRDGLGATVTVTAGGRTQTRHHDGKSGYLAQSALPLYFGLGDAERVESVEVTWPSGATQRVDADIPVAGTLVVSEP